MPGLDQLRSAVRVRWRGGLSGRFYSDAASVMTEGRDERERASDYQFSCAVVLLKARGGNDLAVKGEDLRTGRYHCFMGEYHAKFSGFRGNHRVHRSGKV